MPAARGAAADVPTFDQIFDADTFVLATLDFYFSEATANSQYNKLASLVHAIAISQI